MSLRVFKKIHYLFPFIVLILISISCEKQISKDLSTEGINSYLKQYDYYLRDTTNKEELNNIEKTVIELENSKKNREILQQFTQKVRPEKKFYLHSLKYALEAKDTFDIARSYLLLGYYFDRRHNVDSAYYYFSKAEHLYLSKQDSIRLGEVYLHKAELLMLNAVYGEAETQIMKAIGYNLNNADAKRQFQQQCLVGEILGGLHQYDEAIEIYDRAFEMLESKDVIKATTDYYRRLNRANIYNNVSRIYIKQGRYDEAIAIIHDAIDNYINLDFTPDIKLYAALALNLGICKLRKGEFSEVNNLLTKSISISNKYQNKLLVNHAKLSLAEYYYLSNKPRMAHHLIEEIMTYAEDNKDYQLKMKTLAMLLMYDEDNDPANFETYLSLSKQVIDENSLVRNRFARIKYEADSLIKKNDVLLYEKNLITLISFSFLFLILLIIIILFNKQRTKKLNIIKMFQGDTEKYYDSILNSHNKMSYAQERERKEIAKELHDGVLNKLFITRFSLMQLEEDNFETQKKLLIGEVKDVENYLRGVSHALANEESMLIKSFSQLLIELIALQNRNIAIDFKLHIDETIDLENLSHHAKINIYRILQEGLQNVQKHSQALSCEVFFKYETPTTFTVLVEDNGCGFDTRSVKQGKGLINIKERVEFIGGTLKIVSRVGVGTKLFLYFKIE